MRLFLLLIQDSVWDMMSSLDNNMSGGQTGDDDFKSVKGKKKNMKKKMQKLDSSILGFTVHAAPDRIVGEIESSDKVWKLATYSQELFDKPELNWNCYEFYRLKMP